MCLYLQVAQGLCGGQEESWAIMPSSHEMIQLPVVWELDDQDFSPHPLGRICVMLDKSLHILCILVFSFVK